MLKCRPLLFNGLRSYGFGVWHGISCGLLNWGIEDMGNLFFDEPRTDKAKRVVAPVECMGYTSYGPLLRVVSRHSVGCSSSVLLGQGMLVDAPAFLAAYEDDERPEFNRGRHRMRTILVRSRSGQWRTQSCCMCQFAVEGE